MNLVEFFLIVLPVGAMVFLAGCGFLDMGARAAKAVLRRRGR